MDGQCTVTKPPECYTDEYYQKNLEDGQEYQDFITEQLGRRGIMTGTFQTRKYQWEKGENLLGLEIKHDKNIKKYNRIYIETHERARRREGDYVRSGINDDKNWLFGIGDYSVFFIFGKTMLKRLRENNPNWLYWPVKDKETSKGFCIPIEKAREIAERVIVF